MYIHILYMLKERKKTRENKLYRLSLIPQAS